MGQAAELLWLQARAECSPLCDPFAPSPPCPLGVQTRPRTSMAAELKGAELVTCWVRLCPPESPPFILNCCQVVTAAPQRFQVDILPVDDGTPRVVTNLGLQWLEYTDGKVTHAWPQPGLLLRLLQVKGLLRKTSSSFSNSVFVRENAHPRVHF